jgi:hypothetical protein
MIPCSTGKAIPGQGFDLGNRLGATDHSGDPGLVRHFINIQFTAISQPWANNFSLRRLMQSD